VELVESAAVLTKYAAKVFAKLPKNATQLVATHPVLQV
jgi:hypothetical protein